MNTGGKVLVFGSRSWNEPLVVKHRLRLLPAGTVLVHGASPGGGADLFAHTYGRALGFTVIPVPISDADRKRAQAMSRPKFAPIARNIRMLDEHPDITEAIGFWDGKSTGSKQMRGECKRRGIPVEIIAPAFRSCSVHDRGTA